MLGHRGFTRSVSRQAAVVALYVALVGCVAGCSGGGSHGACLVGSGIGQGCSDDNTEGQCDLINGRFVEGRSCRDLGFGNKSRPRAVDETGISVGDCLGAGGEVRGTPATAPRVTVVLVVDEPSDAEEAERIRDLKALAGDRRDSSATFCHLTETQCRRLDRLWRTTLGVHSPSLANCDGG